MCDISVIIPIYNSSAYLSKCLYSIVNQSFKDYEVLLIDDGSTDKSLQLCNEFQNKYSFVRVFSKANGGASSARNLGIQNAKADWICFVDSDDFVEENYLLHLYQGIEDEDLVINGLKKKDEELKLIEENNFPDQSISIQEKEFYLQQYPLSDYGFSISKLFKKHILLEHSLAFNENIHMFEDAIFVLNYVLFCKKIKFNSYADYNYVVKKSNSLSTTLNPYESELLTFQEFHQLISEDYQITINELKNKYPALGIRLTSLLDRSIATLYIKKYSKDYCLQALRNYAQEDWLLYKYFYNPRNPIKLAIKKLLINKQYRLADLIFRMSYNILNR